MVRGEREMSATNGVVSGQCPVAKLTFFTCCPGGIHRLKPDTRSVRRAVSGRSPYCFAQCL